MVHASRECSDWPAHLRNPVRAFLFVRITFDLNLVMRIKVMTRGRKLLYHSSRQHLLLFALFTTQYKFTNIYV